MDLRYEHATSHFESDVVAGARAGNANAVRLQGVATGSAAIIDAVGDDTNVGLDISSKGTGSVTFWTGARAREALILVDTASAVNEFTITPAATGGRPKFATSGGDTNVGMLLESKGASEIRINSRTYTQTSASTIGFQSKPAQGANNSSNVIGCEISPRVNDTFALTGSGSLIGAHVDAYLKGTTGNIGGDVRGAQIELVTDDAGTRTVTGDVVGLRFRAAFSGTISGDMVVIRAEKAEAQTNSKQWEYFLELTGDNALIWRDDYTTEVTTIAGAIKVRVNDQDRWLPLYSGAPVV